MKNITLSRTEYNYIQAVLTNCEAFFENIDTDFKPVSYGKKYASELTQDQLEETRRALTILTMKMAGAATIDLED